jgi:hypothetical protein
MGMEAQINAMGAFKEEAAVFRKVAFIVTNTFVRGLMATTLAAVKLYTHDKFRSFENEAEALAWLNEA